MAQDRQHRRNYNELGNAHELTFSCYKGFQFLKVERTCQWLADAIEDARVELNFDLWAYVFMPEQVLGCWGVPIAVDPIPAEWLDEVS